MPAVQTRLHVHLVPVLTAVAAFVAAAFPVLVTHPPERWPFELSFAAAMCAVPGGTLAFVVADHGAAHLRAGVGTRAGAGARPRRRRLTPRLHRASGPLVFQTKPQGATRWTDQATAGG